jgi:hypothetical protein
MSIRAHRMFNLVNESTLEKDKIDFRKKKRTTLKKFLKFHVGPLALV